MFGPPKPLSQIQFEKYDADKSGKISVKEFARLCGALGYALTQPEVDLAVKSLDADGSGQIDQKEFSEWWKRSDRWESIQISAEQLAVRQKAAATFNAHDADASGLIDAAEVDAFYKDVAAQGLTKQTKEQFVANLDNNGNGSVSFAEFVAYLKQQGTIA